MCLIVGYTLFCQNSFHADVDDDIDITHINMALLKEIEFLLYFDFFLPSLFTYEWIRHRTET